MPRVPKIQKMPRMKRCSVAATTFGIPGIFGILGIPLVSDVRNQRQLPRPLDRGLQLALVQGTGPRDPARLDLAALRQERHQQPHVLVVDVVDLLRAELADAAAAEEPAAGAIAPLVLVRVSPLRAAAAAATTFLAHRCTSYLSANRSPRS